MFAFPSHRRRKSLIAAVLVSLPAYVSAGSPFAALREALGEREAIVAVPARGNVEVHAISADSNRLLFTTNFVEREQDVYGLYRDVPRFALLAERGLLVFESDGVGRLSAYDFSTGVVSPFEGGDIAAMDAVNRSISPDGRFFAGECRLAAPAPSARKAALRKTLFVGRVVDPDLLRTTLTGFGARPPLADPAFQDSVKRVTSLKAYIGSDQWRLAERDRLMDVRFLSWLPDASGFAWLESKAVAGTTGAQEVVDEVWFYDIRARKQWKLGSADPSILYQAWISEPLHAISPWRAVCVNRMFRYKSVVYSAFLLDASAERAQKVLTNAALVAIR